MLGDDRSAVCASVNLGGVVWPVMIARVARGEEVGGCCSLSVAPSLRDSTGDDEGWW